MVDEERMSEGYDIAVLGVTCTIGEVMLELLGEREFPVKTLYPLEERSAAGGRVDFKGKGLSVGDVAEFNFTRARIAFFCGEAELAAQYGTIAAEAGCIVIDTSPHFREHADVPLVVPEVNAAAIGDYQVRNIIASPGATAIELAVALNPIRLAAGLERVNVVTCEAASTLGKGGIEELASQTANLLNGRPITPKRFSRQIAFNVLPLTDEPTDSGYTGGEMALIGELRRVFEDDALPVNPTIAVVPTFFGHAAAVHAETTEKLGAAAARELLEQAPGLAVIDAAGPDGFPTAVTDAVNADAVYVGRVREDLSHAAGLDLWVVADNVRKGGALNAVQIAEVLVKDYL